MNYKRELEKGVAGVKDILLMYPDRSKEDIEEMSKIIPVKAMKDPANFVFFVKKKKVSLRDAMILMSWIGSVGEFLDDIDVRTDISYDRTVEYFEQARINTIVIHRVNYLLHEAMITVFDLLEKDGRLRFNIKRQANKIEKLWDSYVLERRRVMEQAAWYTLQDHLRLTTDTLSPYIDKVYEVIRDYMIFSDMRDVEAKARCVIALLIGKVARHSFKAFFRDFERESGVDFSRCFASDDMQVMVREFVPICEGMGLGTRMDSYGCYECKMDIEGVSRFRSAWGVFIKAFKDDDLMDESARKAISLNPEVQEEYSHILEEEERKNIIDNVGQL